TDNENSWRLHPTRMEVSGLHHNVFGGFLRLRIGICSFGTGSVKTEPVQLPRERVNDIDRNGRASRPPCFPFANTKWQGDGTTPLEPMAAFAWTADRLAGTSSLERS